MYGVQPYDPSKPVAPKPPSNPMVNSYGAPLQPPTNTVPQPQNTNPSPQTSYGVPQAPSTPVPSPYNATNSTSAPSTGYGGANYGSAGSDVQSGISANESKLNTDSNFVKTEYDRTNQVIAARQAAGLDITDQQNYLSGLRGRMKTSDEPTAAPTGFVPPSPTNTVPIYQPANPVRSADQIAQYARDQVMRKLSDAGLYKEQQIRAAEATAQQQLNALDTQNKRLKTTIGEDRSVQDVTNQRQLSPFSGRSDFALGMLNQQRGRQDQYMQEDYANRQANVNSDVASMRNNLNETYAQLQNAAPDEVQGLIQKLLADERSYDLAVNGQQIDGLMANSQINNTAFDQALKTYGANRGAFENDRNFGLNMDQFGLQQKQSNADMAMKLSQMYGTNVTPTTDWGNMFKQTTGLDPLIMQQFQLDKKTQGEKYALDKLQVAIAQQNANTSSASQQNSASNTQIDNLYKQWQLSGKAPAGIPGVTPGTELYKAPSSSGSTSGGFNLDDYKGYIGSNFYKEVPADPAQPYGAKVKTLDTDAARSYIIGLNLSDSQTDQLLKMYNLPTN